MPVPETLNAALPLEAENVREPPVPFDRVKTLAALFVRLIEPTVIAAFRGTVCVPVGLLNVALAPTAFGNPEGVQLPATFQRLVVPVVKLKVWPNTEAEAAKSRRAEIPTAAIRLVGAE